jgi:flagellar protein FliS
LPLANPYAKYQQTSAKTADRGDLVVLSYEAILRWLGRADQAIDGGKLLDAHEALVAAQDLVLNLSNSLDYERGGQIAQNLGSLYEYMRRELIQANVQKNKDIIASIRDLISPLLDAWRTAVVQARKEGYLSAV